MDTLLLTLGIAFVVVVAALALLGISWLVTGKSKIRPGACGRDPTKKQKEDESCATTTSCHLCKHPEDKKNNDDALR